MPKFAFDYVDAALGEEGGAARNRQAFSGVQLCPRYLMDVSSVDTSCELFGQRYTLGFGVAPVGLGNMMWPQSETALATAAAEATIPYILSTASTTGLEEIGAIGKGTAWFQLYVPRDEGVMEDLITRARSAGFGVLVVTLDVPIGAKRERELRNGLNLPFRFTPKLFYQIAVRPRWALATARQGTPEFVNLKRYTDQGQSTESLSEFVSKVFVRGVTQERIARIRSLWDGPLVLKGVQHLDDARKALELGVDGLIVSNHGGRQLDAAPSSIEVLPAIADAVGDRMTIMIDSGVRSGLDVLRARALGARCAFSGRSFFFGMGALGHRGATQVIEIFRDDITRGLMQIGCLRYAELDASWLRQK
jgi:isopentenyl diphosphate isomerase/L-lactate dehydrogenase-like FMN-dependent dehydrogenase